MKVIKTRGRSLLIEGEGEGSRNPKVALHPARRDERTDALGPLPRRGGGRKRDLDRGSSLSKRKQRRG